MPERLRMLFAIAGILLWGALIWVAPSQVFSIRQAWWEEHCAGCSFTGRFDECFNDYIPVLEVAGLPLMVLITLIPFAILAISLFSPPAEERAIRWHGALGNDSSRGVPGRLLAGLILLLFVGWCWHYLPLRHSFLRFHLFWAALAAWVVVGMALRLHDRQRLRFKDN